MPSACLHVFSGTGNSLNAASIIQSRLEAAGWSARIVRVDHTTIPPSGSYDLHIVAFPVYALDAPEILIRYLKCMPAGNGAEGAVIAIIGKLYTGHKVPGDSGDEGGAVEHVRRILVRKGYDITVTDAVPYPSNVTIGRVCSERQEVPGILRQSEEHVNRIADTILSRKQSVKIYPPVIPQFWAYSAGLVFQIIGRRGIGKMFVATRKCTSCGRCARICPAGAIRMVRGRPRWNWQCEACHRCINTCPQEAIEGSALRGIIGIALIFVPYALLFAPILAGFGIVLPATGIPAFLGGLLCWIVGYILGMGVLDILCAQVERPPVDCPIALFGYTRGAERYVNPSADVAALHGSRDR